MALCTQIDVEQRLQIDFGNDSEPVVTGLIAAAQGHIEREYGGAIEAATYTGETHSAAWRTSVFLRNHPVTAVTTVTEDGTALTEGDDFAWEPDGTIQRVSGGRIIWWKSLKVGGIVVTYDAGYADVPEDIVDVCAWMVADAFRRGVAFSSDEGGESGLVISESIDGYSASYRDDSMDPSRLVLMTAEQRDVIHHYRLSSNRRKSGFGVA